MINLAGHKDATEIITEELIRCEIPVICVKDPIGEPKALVKGNLQGFEFTRAWYYYIVKGKVPLWVNNTMYADYVCHKDVRAGGDCVRRNIWEKYYAEDGREVVYIPNSDIDMYYKHMPKILKEYINVSKPEDKIKFGKPFVDLYHIDSELGLYKFVQYIKNLGIYNG